MLLPSFLVRHTRHGSGENLYIDQRIDWIIIESVQIPHLFYLCHISLYNCITLANAAQVGGHEVLSPSPHLCKSRLSSVAILPRGSLSPWTSLLQPDHYFQDGTISSGPHHVLSLEPISMLHCSNLSLPNVTSNVVVVNSSTCSGRRFSSICPH